MASPYDHKALWVKARMFINRATDEDGYRSFDERSLWAALALELLAKAALARVSPLLIAEPSEDGINLLVASGLTKGDARFTSVRAKTLFLRCQAAFKPFNAKEATAITNGRNEYLHSSGVGFTGIPQDAWWPKYWAQASILVSALDRDISQFVGVDRESAVSAHLAQNARNIEHRTEALIERAKQRLHQYQEGNLSAKVAAEFRLGFENTAWMQYKYPVTCPACGNEAWLEGDNVSDTQVAHERMDEHEIESYVTLTVDADYFGCSTCQLTLDSFELIEQAGLPTQFDAEGDMADLYPEGEYGND